MGMFDWVDYECKCPKCGSLVDGFQSKCGPCTMATLKPREAGCFYSSCRNCKEWIEVDVKIHNWRSVKEELPQTSDLVLTYSPELQEEYPYRLIRPNCNVSAFPTSVEFWQPLPEPPDAETV